MLAAGPKLEIQLCPPGPGRAAVARARGRPLAGLGALPAMPWLQAYANGDKRQKIGKR